jgi:hypothetical protein
MPVKREGSTVLWLVLIATLTAIMVVASCTPVRPLPPGSASPADTSTPTETTVGSAVEGTSELVVVPMDHLQATDISDEAMVVLPVNELSEDMKGRIDSSAVQSTTVAFARYSLFSDTSTIPENALILMRDPGEAVSDDWKCSFHTELPIDANQAGDVYLYGLDASVEAGEPYVLNSPDGQNRIEIEACPVLAPVQAPGETPPTCMCGLICVEAWDWCWCPCDVAEP